MPTLTQIIADAYRKMVNPPQAVIRPKWVPASIREESVPAFIEAITEARMANKSIVEFNGKKYGIKGVKEDANEEDQGKGKKIQDMDAENAPKQDSDELPDEVKEEDSEEIKNDNISDKEKDADEMQKIAASQAPGDKRAEMAEKLVGNQHKLDVNKNEKIDADDLKKLRGEEKEEDSEEEHKEPDADNAGGPSDDDEDNVDEGTHLTGEQAISAVANAYVQMVSEEDEYAGDNPVDKLHFDVPAFIRVLEKAREDFKTDEDIHNFTQQLLAMKSNCIHTADLPDSPMKEGTGADSEAGPEVTDPVTQKAKDDADDETEIKDGVPSEAQDGADKMTPVFKKKVMQNESVTEVDEDFKLDKVTHVRHGGDSKEFAKHYVAAHRGDYRSSGPSKHDSIDNKNAETFHANYDVAHIRTGFAGDRITVFTHKKTGEKFKVDRKANGKTFYGTDHVISRVS